MIEKFNFYDVYGYFLPGAALIALLWLPFGLVAHVLPSGDWSSAVLGVALAYLVGHLMLYVSTNLIPSHDIAKSVPGQDRSPSETVLDGDSSALSKEVREKIAEAVKCQFKWELHVEDCTRKYDSIRKEAFFLARQRLIREKAASYAEQFQGMYSLTRGLVVAFAVGAAYYFGWVLSVVRCLLVGAYILAFLSFLLMLNLTLQLWWEENQQRQRKENRKALSEEEQKRLRGEDRKWEQRLQAYFAGAVLLAFSAVGYIIGFGYKIDGKTCISLALVMAATLVALMRCYMQYRSFTVHFATTVWRAFATCASSESGHTCSAQFE